MLAGELAIVTRRHALRLGQHVLHREHAAPRLAQQMDPVQAQGRPHRVDLIGERLDRPQLRPRLRDARQPAADLVVEDHPAPGLRDRLERLEVVVAGARTAVEREQRQLAVVLAGAVDAVPGLVAEVRDRAVRERDVGHEAVSSWVAGETTGRWREWREVGRGGQPGELLGAVAGDEMVGVRDRQHAQQRSFAPATVDRPADTAARTHSRRCAPRDTAASRGSATAAPAGRRYPGCSPAARACTGGAALGTAAAPAPAPRSARRT